MRPHGAGAGLPRRRVPTRAGAWWGPAAFHVEVAPECSGYEGIGLIWVFLAAYLWFFRRTLRFPQALWLLPVGTVVIWLANVARIVALVAVGTWVSPAVALGGFHSQAGWLAFNAVALGLVAVSRRARLFAADAGAAAAAAAAPAANPTAAYLVPLLALVAAVMVTAALSAGDGFDALLPGPGRWPSAAALWVFRRGLRRAAVVVVVAGGRRRGGRLRGLDGARTVAGRRGRPSAAWPRASPAASRLAAALAGGAGGRLGRHGADRRGAGLPRLPDPPADRGRLHERPPRPVHLALVRRLVAACSASCTAAGSPARSPALLYALALYRKGDLSEAVLAHATTNALIAAYVLTTGAWSLWA